MLIDRATIFVRSGKGGDGCVSFRREKYVPRGGPDGGDGGKGGDVIVLGDASMSTLLAITQRPHFRAKSGGPGMGKSRHGADGADCVVRVPLGTLVYDHETGDRIADVTGEGRPLVVAAGGRGGFGNEHFKSATNQTPREATPGEPMVEHVLRLELKLIADVGLVGKPNAGKSTMLRAVSRAHPKVADYPFTTRSPCLGIAELPSGGRGSGDGGRTGGSGGGAGRGERRMVIADIPGLIEGAAAGAGLGHDFLRHVERTRILVHVLDVRPLDGSDPVRDYETIRRELFEYSAELAEKREIIVLNKIDLVPAEERSETLRRVAVGLRLREDETLLTASGATGEGVREVLEACWRELGEGGSEGGS